MSKFQNLLRQKREKRADTICSEDNEDSGTGSVLLATPQYSLDKIPSMKVLQRSPTSRERNRRVSFRTSTRATLLPSPKQQPSSASPNPTIHVNDEPAPQPLIQRTKSLRLKRKEDTSIRQDRLLEHIAIFSNQISQLLEDENQAGIVPFPETVRSKMSTLTTHLEDLKAEIVKSKAAVGLDGRSSNEFLVDLSCVSFNNLPATSYRSAAARVHSEETEPAYCLWHRPRFLSSSAVPPFTSVIVIVRLGGGLTARTQGAAQSKTLRVVPTDSAEKILATAVVALLYGRQAPPSDFKVADFTLKNPGMLDYMYGEDRYLVDYEYIRQCLREKKKPELHVVPIPVEAEWSHNAVNEEFVANRDSYLQQVADYTPINLGGPSHVHLSEWKEPLRFRLDSLFGVSQQAFPELEAGWRTGLNKIYVVMFLFHGLEIVPDTIVQTKPVAKCDSVLIDHVVEYPHLSLASLPRETRAAFVVYGEASRPRMLGHVTMALFNEKDTFNTSIHQLRMWPYHTPESEQAIEQKEEKQRRKTAAMTEKASLRNPYTFLFRGSTHDNSYDSSAAVLKVDFGTESKLNTNVFSPMVTMPVPRDVDASQLPAIHPATLAEVQELFLADIMKDLNFSTTELVWHSRKMVLRSPEQLPLVLRCCNWFDAKARAQAAQLLAVIPRSSQPLTAISLLDARFADFTVRSYAVGLLEAVDDLTLAMYLLQLTQCIKFELYNESPLVRFLMRRALANPLAIGMPLYWHLHTESLLSPYFRERYCLILQELVTFCPVMALELRKQKNVCDVLERVSASVKQSKEDKLSEEKAMEKYHFALEELNRGFFTQLEFGKFRLPFNPKIEVRRLLVDKCKYMSSKTVPLWLVFENADPNGDDVYVIFKLGDDLRQDILTLQLLRIMGDIWTANSLDMCLTYYTATAMGLSPDGEGMGMMEVVLNAKTTSSIQMEYGGSSIGAFKTSPLHDYVKEHNKAPLQYQEAINNFTASCAGYCVATYVMGIGDRHNGNIMVQKNGRLLHIDFGHFLGNFMTKMGISRERTPFVFTSQMAYVILDGKKFNPQNERYIAFEKRCVDAFELLRNRATEMESMFLLMVSAGLPELVYSEDVIYLRDMLCLDMTQEQAAKSLKKNLSAAMNDSMRVVDNFAHLYVHGQ